ncbi:MAG: amidohydrolase family protein, partial [Acidimicrobiales bacterium]
AGADSGAPARRRRLGTGRLFHELLSSALALLLGVAPDEVASARDEIARPDWSGYVRRLFEDAGITGMILDEGVSSSHQGQVPAYTELTGRPFWRLARVDPLVDKLIGEGAGAAEIVRAVEYFLEDASSSGAVGFKTILAYRTGLAVDPAVGLKEAGLSLSSSGRGDEPVRHRGKALRDLVTRTVLERAADLGRPVQIHTGFGDSELRLVESNPLLLEDVLRSPAGSAATVVLIHGSYPWHEELAYLATVRPNVYAEMSLSNLFAPLRTPERLGLLLELAPRDKVLAGSDGHAMPETHWFACRLLRDGFRKLSSEMIAAGARPAWVEATREAVFEHNARAVYQLD